MASATVNSCQQVGGSIGTAFLNTIATTAVTSYLVGKAVTPLVAAQAAVHGYTVAFWWAAGIFLLGAIVSGTLLRPGVAMAGAGAEAPNGSGGCVSILVTISASYGAGGSWIGPQVAERLGSLFIDRAIPVQVAERLDVPVAHAHVHDEAAAPPFTRLLARLPNTSGVVLPEATTDAFCRETERVLIDAADAGDVVVLGRAGALVLRDRPDAFHVVSTGRRRPACSRRCASRRSVRTRPGAGSAPPIAPGSTTSSTSIAPTREIRATTSWCSTRQRCRCRHASS